MTESGQKPELTGKKKWLALSLCLLAGLALAFFVGRSALEDVAAFQRATGSTQNSVEPVR